MAVTDKPPRGRPTTCYQVDDNDFWNTTPGEESKLAIPRALVPGVLALIHSTYDHPGVGRTLMLVRGKYQWTTVAQDVKDYVFSCGCKRRKRAGSQWVAMMTAWLLWLWEVLEMDLQDMKHVSSVGNRYLLVVVEPSDYYSHTHCSPKIPSASRGSSWGCCSCSGYRCLSKVTPGGSSRLR